MKQDFSIKRNHLHGHRLSSGAFTRIELLVVVAIVGILAVLLAVVVGQDKKRTACQNSLRQWAVAMHMYVDDNAQDLPREGHRRNRSGKVDQDYWVNVADPNNRDVWYNCLPAELGRKSAGSYASITSGNRAKFYEDTLFHCPAAIFEPDKAARATAYFSLAMNSKLIRYPNLTIKMSSILNPSTTVILMDAFVSDREFDKFKVDLLQNKTSLGQPAAWASRFSARHSGGGNLAFCDGSARWLQGKDVVETTPKSLNQGRAIWPNSKVKWLGGIENPN